MNSLQRFCFNIVSRYARHVAVLDIQKHDVRAEIENRISDDGRSCPVTFYLTGDGMQETSGIPFFPGTELYAGGTWAGKAGLINNSRTKPLFIYPYGLRVGGGNAGFDYSHHTKIANLRLEGGHMNQPLFDLYNGGMQCHINNVMMKNAGDAPLIRCDRTMMNLTIDKFDASDSNGVVAFTNAGTIGRLIIRDGQMDDVGVPFQFSYHREGGHPGHVDKIRIQDLKWEDHSGLPVNFVQLLSSSRQASANIRLDGISAAVTGGPDGGWCVENCVPMPNGRPATWLVEDASFSFLKGSSSPLVRRNRMVNGDLRLEAAMTAKYFPDNTDAILVPTCLCDQEWRRY